jgi:formate--tetrahydrofolate ligase
VKKIIIAFDYNDKPVYLAALHIEDAIYRLMQDALLPNLVQTIEGNPALVHGGPFANIAHGCNSVIATRFALSRAPVVVTEAGFASELGAEKFCNIKCRSANIRPHLAVIVATIKALKLHGGVSDTDLKTENTAALISGISNLVQHYENMQKFNIPVLVALNEFADDFPNEIAEFEKIMSEKGYEYTRVTSVRDGSVGAEDFAAKARKLMDTPSSFTYLYDVNLPIKTKIETIATTLYRARDVVYSEEALQALTKINDLGLSNLPVCMAKTPLSFSDNPLLKNVPEDFTLTIREFRISAGAGFIVALTGKVLTMPGLPKTPAAVNFKEVR